MGHRDTGKVVAHGNGLGAGLTHAALCVSNRDRCIGQPQGAGGRIGPAAHHAGGVVRIFGGNHHSGAAELLPVLVGGFRGCCRHGNAGQGADRDRLGAGLCDAVFRVGDRHRRVRLGKGAAGGVRPARHGLFWCRWTWWPQSPFRWRRNSHRCNTRFCWVRFSRKCWTFPGP